jgi:hypothetical protein
VSTLAGTGGEGYQDGEGTNAHFDEPCGVAVDGVTTSLWLTGTTIVSA